LANQYTKKKQSKTEHKRLLLMKSINCLLSGGLVLFGACSNGGITLESLGLSAGAAVIAFIMQFKKVVEEEITEHSKVRLFTFVG